MSTYPNTIRARATPQRIRSLAVWAALGAALIGTVVVLVLAVSDEKTPPKNLSRSEGASSQVQPNSRFDGGPNEGTRGAAVQYSATTRFDGGPNEGTRGR